MSINYKTKIKNRPSLPLRKPQQFDDSFVRFNEIASKIEAPAPIQIVESSKDSGGSAIGDRISMILIPDYLGVKGDGNGVGPGGKGRVQEEDRLLRYFQDNSVIANACRYLWDQNQPAHKDLGTANQQENSSFRLLVNNTQQPNPPNKSLPKTDIQGFETQQLICSPQHGHHSPTKKKPNNPKISRDANLDIWYPRGLRAGSNVLKFGIRGKRIAIIVHDGSQEQIRKGKGKQVKIDGVSQEKVKAFCEGLGRTDEEWSSFVRQSNKKCIIAHLYIEQGTQSRKKPNNPKSSKLRRTIQLQQSSDQQLQNIPQNQLKIESIPCQNQNEYIITLRINHTSMHPLPTKNDRLMLVLDMLLEEYYRDHNWSSFAGGNSYSTILRGNRAMNAGGIYSTPVRKREGDSIMMKKIKEKYGYSDFVKKTMSGQLPKQDSKNIYTNNSHNPQDTGRNKEKGKDRSIDTNTNKNIFHGSSSIGLSQDSSPSKIKIPKQLPPPIRRIETRNRLSAFIDWLCGSNDVLVQQIQLSMSQRH